MYIGGNGTPSAKILNPELFNPERIYIGGKLVCLGTLHHIVVGHAAILAIEQRYGHPHGKLSLLVELAIGLDDLAPANPEVVLIRTGPEGFTGARNPVEIHLLHALDDYVLYLFYGKEGSGLHDKGKRRDFFQHSVRLTAGVLSHLATIRIRCIAGDVGQLQGPCCSPILYDRTSP